MQNREYRDTIIRCMEAERLAYINKFILEGKNKEYIDLWNDEYVPYMNKYIKDYQFSYGEYEILKNYTGFQARYVNNYLRNGWVYKELGPYDQKSEEDYKKYAEVLEEMIQKTKPLNFNFNLYRGVSMIYFKGYGINDYTDLAELKKLEGSMFYDKAFVSTSIDRDSSFFLKSPIDNFCNIEITYHVDGTYSDGILLSDSNMSFSPNSKEFLINKGNMSYIDSVKIEDGKAYIDMYLIPKQIINMRFTSIKQM